VLNGNTVKQLPELEFTEDAIYRELRIYAKPNKDEAYSY
jgi:hypothetical protein